MRSFWNFVILMSERKIFWNIFVGATMFEAGVDLFLII